MHGFILAGLILYFIAAGMNGSSSFFTIAKWYITIFITLFIIIVLIDENAENK